MNEGENYNMWLTFYHSVPLLLLMYSLVNRSVINYMFSLCLSYFSSPSMLSESSLMLCYVSKLLFYELQTIIYYLLSLHPPLDRQCYFQVLAVREMLTWTLEPKDLGPFSCIGCALRSRTTGTWSVCSAFCLFACLFLTQGVISVGQAGLELWT